MVNKFDNDNIVIVDIEQEVIKIVRNMTAKGNTIKSIINYLAQQGYSNRNGNNFGISEIWKMKKSA